MGFDELSLNRNIEKVTDIERAKEIINISSFTNRDLRSSVGIYADVYADGEEVIKPLSLTDDECKELAKESPFSYEEIKEVFGGSHAHTGIN